MQQGAETPPFGIGPAVLPAIDRATWLAKTLFGAFDANVVLVQGDSVWRSRDGEDLPPVDREAVDARRRAETEKLFDLLRASTAEVPPGPPRDAERTPEAFRLTREHRLAVIAAQRSALLDARDDGTFDADVLADALANLDADEIAMELRGKLAT